MNRDQALAIVENFDLIKHFAYGGEIAHAISGYKKPSRSILICNLHGGEVPLYKIIPTSPTPSPEEDHRVT